MTCIARPLGCCRNGRVDWRGCRRGGRRGQRGRVEAGKSGGGNAYGYDVVKKFDANGEPIRGDRTINEFQAEVVRRIFRDYAAGKSAKTIAFALNKEGIPAPSGGDWGFSTNPQCPSPELRGFLRRDDCR